MSDPIDDVVAAAVRLDAHGEDRLVASPTIEGLSKRLLLMMMKDAGEADLQNSKAGGASEVDQ